ncbi:hypothetical protein, partial [Pseudomonas amygdali]|uniref:hypothetical protein n=1 Tax=Pseudomonas amygdali TaxID=47877 RepID=UPI00195B7B82
LTGDEFDAMALTGQHFNFHRLLLGQHIGSSKPPVLPRGVNSRLALGGHFYSGGDICDLASLALLYIPV